MIAVLFHLIIGGFFGWLIAKPAEYKPLFGIVVGGVIPFGVLGMLVLWAAPWLKSNFGADAP